MINVSHTRAQIIKGACLLALLGTFVPTPHVQAQECLIGEIKMFAGNFAPRGWTRCDGQLLQISHHPALFSILGTTYGGDGRRTFAVPDLRGRVPLGTGQGSNLTHRRLGERGGEEDHFLTEEELPSHTHTAMASGQLEKGRDRQRSPEGHVLAHGNFKIYSTQPADVEMAESTISETGGNEAHNNMPPYLGLNYILCLQGQYPSRH